MKCLHIFARILYALSVLTLSACSVFGPSGYRPEGEELPPETGREVAQTARAQIGVPYTASGISPRMGFDCSGLVYYSFQRHGFTLPREASKQAQFGQHISTDDVREGDILVFKTGFFHKHTGIYIGNDEFVHAPGRGRKVEKKRLDAPHWQRMLVDVRRVPLQQMRDNPQE